MNRRPPAAATARGRDRLHQAAEVIKLLGHPDRLRIVAALEARELTVSELCRRCGLEQAICSQHLRRLRQHAVVTCRRAGPHVHYRVISPRVRHILDCIGGARA